MRTDYLAGLRAHGTFFDRATFDLLLEIARAESLPGACCGPFMGAQLFLFHKNAVADLSCAAERKSHARSSSPSLVPPLIKSLTSEYLTRNHITKSLRHDPLLLTTARSTRRVFETVCRDLNRPLSQIAAKDIHGWLETREEFKYVEPASIWLELSAVNDVPPVYSPLRPAAPPIRRAPYMDPEVFKRAIEMALAEYGPSCGVHLAGWGEPIQHPRFLDLIRILNGMPLLADRRFCDVTLYTDARFLDRPMQAVILASPIDVLMISLDAVRPDVYAAVRPGGSFDTVMGNVTTLLDHKRERIRADRSRTRPHIALTTTLIRETEPHIREFMDFQLPFRSFVKNTLGNRADGRRQKDAWAAFYEAGHVVEHMVIQGPSTYAGSRPDIRIADYTPLNRFPCRRLLKTLFILSDGSVVPCDRVREPEGGAERNILKADSMQAVWDSLGPARNSHLERRYDDLMPRCTSCEDWYIPVD